VEKFEANRKRDVANVAALEAMGYRVATVWECDIERDVEAVIRSVVRLLVRRPKA
jgi:DNA mismatch endonuclease (patch repair protein)